MEHAKEIVRPMFPAHGKSAVVLKPCKQPFDFPTTTVAAERAAILSPISPVAPVWSNHLDPGLGQIVVQLVRVVGVVTDQAFYRLGYENFGQSLLNECDLVRRGGFRANSDG
jgi:hypothetical protein